MHTRNLKFNTVSLLILLILPSVGYGQPPAAEGGFEWTIGTWHVADASLDAGGDWSATSFNLEGGWKWKSGSGKTLGISLGYEHQDHSFGSGFDPWDSVQRTDLSFSWNQRINNEWSLLVTPTIGLSMEDGADTSDALQYGTILAFNQFVSPSLQWGFGFGYFGGLEDSTGFPLLLIRWQIDKNWYVGNPFSPGPVGPAGLEVGYRVNETWSVAAGSAYRSERFRLKDTGQYADGYGETEGAVLFIRSNHSFAGGDLHLLVGMLVAGELQIDDSNGSTLMKTDMDPAPIASISWESRF